MPEPAARPLWTAAEVAAATGGALTGADRPIGGLGVFLVKEFMDRTEYRRDGDRNVITLWKNT